MRESARSDVGRPATLPMGDSARELAIRDPQAWRAEEWSAVGGSRNREGPSPHRTRSGRRDGQLKTTLPILLIRPHPPPQRRR